MNGSRMWSKKQEGRIDSCRTHIAKTVACTSWTSNWTEKKGRWSEYFEKKLDARGNERGPSSVFFSFRKRKKMRAQQ